MDRPDLISRAVLRALARLGAFGQADLATIRARADRVPLPRTWLRRGLAVHDLHVPGAAGPLPARLYVPRRRARGHLLFLHGGGFVMCGLDSHEGICAALARASRARVLAVDYRLAPEHPFPAAPEDCFAAWRWLVAQADGPVAVAGDSAGGTLAAALCLMARDRGVAPPRAQLLFYPATTGREDVPSRALFAHGFLLTTEMLHWFERQYLGERGEGGRDEGGRDEASPYYMPARAADLGRLPPALIVTAAFDPLRDEGQVYADRLRAAGVEVRYRCVPGTIHGFLNFHPVMPKARFVLRTTGRAIRRVLARP